MSQKFNHTKIIATIGPSTDSKAKLKELAKTGVNVFRINFSHGAISEHEKTINLINQVIEETGINIAIMADLQGPKIRVGKMAEGLS